MSSYLKPTVRPEVGQFYGFHHLRFYVSNAKQAAAYYCARFGMHRLAYAGLETGSTKECTEVVSNSDVILAFTSALEPRPEDPISQHVSKHSDGVRDVAFRVDDARGIYEKAVSRGAIGIQDPEELCDEFGSVLIATIQTYGDTVHSFVQIIDYTGPFLPGYVRVANDDPINLLLPSVSFEAIDHVVGNQPDFQMEPTAKWYETMLDFHRYWSVDDRVLHTEYSALRSIVMADFDEVVKMPINEPADGIRKSQIQEYVDYYGGPGVQHIAIRTKDIINTIQAMKIRGIEFLSIPSGYYKSLRQRLSLSNCEIEEDLSKIEELEILVDFDDKGYLLQIFTRPVEDRPTLFFEVIQRHNNNGFGIGNFKALFEALEQEQERRGNLN